jgi:hypothetical protein
VKRTAKTSVLTYAVLMLAGGISFALPERVAVPDAPSSSSAVPLLPPAARVLRPDIVREEAELRAAAELAAAKASVD